MNTLKLFNAVVEKKDMLGAFASPFVSDAGYVIVPEARWAKDRILDFYEKEKLSGNDLNKTFYKSWKKVVDSTRYELFSDQIRHYLSTYGSNFQDEIFIPDGVVDLPELKLKYKVIRTYTKEEMVKKCLQLLKSGIALKEETIDIILTVLVDELHYEFTGKEGIRNKEAVVKIADLYGILPSDVMEFFRYIIYRATGQSLLIKSNDLIAKIKTTTYNPSVQFKKFGLKKLAEIFNRFKPLFLAFKPKCGATINRIGKLSKTHHKPMISNPLNSVTSSFLNHDDIHWLDNATPFALFKAMSACHTRMNGQSSFVYRIRNGKSWVTKEEIVDNGMVEVNVGNYNRLLNYLKERFDLSDKKIFLPKDIKYALPTSEKMFVGNIPTGTRFYGNKLAVGIYWRDDWGARDLDLSGVNVDGKIGWNAGYYDSGNTLVFSGDITSAPNGAVEYLYARDGLSAPTLVQNNVYSGDPECDYKIVIGKGDKMSRDYMMNPNNLFAEVKCKSVQQQTILGIFLPADKHNTRQYFTLLNFGAGHVRVSGHSPLTSIATEALVQQWSRPLSFNKIVKLLGAEVVNLKEEADFNYELDSLEKDSFTKIFETLKK